MSNLKGKQYYKTDKDIHDQLKQNTPGKTSILRHLQMRGLLFSDKIDKDDLIEQTNCWFTSFFDVKFITEELGGGNSQRRNNSTEIMLKYDKELIAELLADLKKDCGFNHQSLQNGSFTITKNYSTPDFTKNVLSQTTHHKAEIKIEKTEDDNILIRTNTDIEASNIVNKIKEKIKENKKEEYKEFQISFEHIVDAKARTEFFLEIIKHIDGYKTIDMKAASISLLDTPNTMMSDNIDTEKVGLIKKVILNGGSVHESPELNSLLSRGFYLTKIEWTMESESSTGDKIDLCAEFEDTINCTKFKYALQRIYTRKEDDSFVKTGKVPSDIELSIILPKIEKSAKESFIMIRDNYSKNTVIDDEND